MRRNCSLVEEGEEYKKCDTIFFSQNPVAAKFKAPDTVFIKVKLTHVKSTDFTQHPPVIEESRLI